MKTCREFNKATGKIVKIVWTDSNDKPAADTLFKVIGCKACRVTLQKLSAADGQTYEQPVQFPVDHILRYDPVGTQYPSIKIIVG